MNKRASGGKPATGTRLRAESGWGAGPFDPPDYSRLRRQPSVETIRSRRMHWRSQGIPAPYSVVRASRHAPFLLDIQADLLADLDTRVVVPLIRASLRDRREIVIGAMDVLLAGV